MTEPPARALRTEVGLLLLTGALFLILPFVRDSLESSGRRLVFWQRGLPLDALTALTPSGQRAVLRDLTVETAALPEGLLSDLRSCLGGEARSCARAVPVIAQATRAAEAQHRIRLGLILGLVTVASLLLVGGGIRLARHATRSMSLLLFGGVLLWLAALGLEAQGALAAARQTRLHAQAERLVLTTRLALQQKHVLRLSMLTRVRADLDRIEGLPAAARADLRAVLDPCLRALRQEGRPARCQGREAGCLNALAQTSAAHCPNLVVPLTRLRRETLAPLPGQTSQAWARDWLGQGGLLLLLLLPLIRAAQRRRNLDSRF